jgi:twitching motility protein PilT
MEVPSILLNRLLSETAKRGAVSLHLTVGSLPSMRLAGVLTPLEKETIVTAEFLTKIIGSFLTADETNQLAAEKEIVLMKVFGSSFRFRVNIFYQKKMLSASFFYIPQEVKGLSEYKLPSELVDALGSASGLFVVAGAKSGGKTTFVASIIEEINKTQSQRIITIERPIEYAFVSKKSIVEQRQVGIDVKTFVDAIDYCLEEDVEVVMISEVTKGFDEAMPAILELAAGNALVILEINAANSIRAIEKIMSAAKANLPEEAACYSLADALIGVVVIELLPRRGGGLVPAMEIMLVNSAVKSLIREGKIYQLDSVIQTSRKEGMISLEKAIEELADAGEIKPEE